MLILENVEHCRGEPELIPDNMSLMSDVIHQVNHPGLLHAHPFTGGFQSAFACWFTNLSWHIATAGFFTIAKLQNAQVAKFSPEIAKYHICQPFSSQGS